MRTVLVLSLLVALATAFRDLDLNAPLESIEIIEAVNNANTTWKAGRNFDSSFTKSYLKHLLGLKRRPGGSRLPTLIDDEEDQDLELPSNFDARQKWSSCISLQEVRDQGSCGSCWAVSAAATLTDRFCIATKTKFNNHLSAEDLMSCGSKDGCHGDFDDVAWNYFLHSGICTGGDYDSQEGCQPYTVPPCEHHIRGPRKNCTISFVDTPKCQKSCYNKKYKSHTKDQDLYKVKSVFTIRGDIKKIQKEIYKHGPVQAEFQVYDDFVSYKKAVYKHTKGSLIGSHAVKIIGWGNEDGTDYWLVANSWNSDWGDNGFFKIRRGTNECGIESAVNGGYPDV